MGDDLWGNNNCGGLPAIRPAVVLLPRSYDIPCARIRHSKQDTAIRWVCYRFPTYAPASGEAVIKGFRGFLPPIRTFVLCILRQKIRHYHGSAVFNGGLLSHTLELLRTQMMRSDKFLRNRVCTRGGLPRTRDVDQIHGRGSLFGPFLAMGNSRG